MISISNTYYPAKAIGVTLQDARQDRQVDAGKVKAAASPDAAISDLAGRLSHASQVSSDRNAGLGSKELALKAQANIDQILYPLDEAHKAAAALELPQPRTADSIASADSATAFVNDNALPNPFAGLSREQLAAISHDESGTFTVNERRAAFMQAYNEEQAWRLKVVEAAQRELDEKGSLTGFFNAAREHFMELPLAEQVLYPATYAADLAGKIDLDLNYRGDIAVQPAEMLAADIWSMVQAPRLSG